MKRTDCPNIIVGCPGVDDPISNTSSESPDPLLFSGVGWSPYDPYRPPPLGGGINVPFDCSNITWSDVSQEMADLLAKINAITCQPPAIPNGQWPPLPPFPPFPAFPAFPPLPDLIQPGFIWTPPTWTQPAGPDYQQFYNTAQSATATCPNGALFTYTVLAGTIVSGPMPAAIGAIWVELANAYAEATALQQVWALRACIDVPFVYFRFPPSNFNLLPPPGWPIGVPWPFTIGPTPPPGWPIGVPWPFTIGPTPPPGWPIGVPWPFTIGPTPPPGWPTGTAWPPPSRKGPKLSDNPGYICLGSALDPALNKYTVSGTGSFTFSIIAGALAPGTALVSAGPRAVEVQGTPTATGEYNYTLLAVRDGMPGVQVQVEDTLWVFGLVTSTIPSITVGTPYAYQLVADGGQQPVSCQDVSVFPDGLPTGLVMDSSGLISGTPIGLGTGKFQVQITDASLESAQCTQQVTIGEIVPPVVGCPDWNTIAWNTFLHAPNATFTVNGLGNIAYLSWLNQPGGGGSTEESKIVQAGGPCNCNLHVHVNSNTANIWQWQILDSSFNIISAADLSGLPQGDYDFPFVLPSADTFILAWDIVGDPNQFVTANLSYTNV
jgi:hypothetical protein